MPSFASQPRRSAARTSLSRQRSRTPSPSVCRMCWFSPTHRLIGAAGLLDFQAGGLQHVDDGKADKRFVLHQRDLHGRGSAPPMNVRATMLPREYFGSRRLQRGRRVPHLRVASGWTFERDIESELSSLLPKAARMACLWTRISPRTSRKFASSRSASPVSSPKDRRWSTNASCSSMRRSEPAICRLASSRCRRSMPRLLMPRFSMGQRAGRVRVYGPKNLSRCYPAAWLRSPPDAGLD